MDCVCIENHERVRTRESEKNSNHKNSVDPNSSCAFPLVLCVFGLIQKEDHCRRNDENDELGKGHRAQNLTTIANFKSFPNKKKHLTGQSTVEKLMLAIPRKRLEKKMKKK